MKLGETKKVIVAGAGLAGLAAAYELYKLGHEVTVLEAGTTPGGRVHTLRSRFADDLHADAGAMFLPADHPLPLAYARDLGLPLQEVHAAGSKRLFFVAGQRIVAGGGATIQWPDALALNKDEQGLPPQKLVEKYTGAVMGTIGDPKTANWPPDNLRSLDAMSYGDLLRSRGASHGAITIIGLGLANLLGDGLESYSALFKLRDQTLDGGGPSSLILGGNDQLPRALAAKLKDCIFYGSEVQAISQDRSEVQVTARRSGGTRIFKADYMVCALPFSVLHRIAVTPPFSTAKQRAIRELPYTSVIRIFLQMKKRFWVDEGLSGVAFTDLPTMAVFPVFNQDGTRGILSCYAAGPNARTITSMTEEARISFALSQLEKFYPQVHDYFEAGSTVCWSSDPRTCGAYVYARPGQLFTFRDTLNAREDRVHFAGDHTSAWPGWIQGALDSGRRCAKEIDAASNVAAS